jgi:hypothetical protein
MASDIDWTNPKFLDAINTSLTATAKCRGAFKAISQNLGTTTVIVPSIAPGDPLAYGPDQVESAVQVYVDVNVDEQQHAGDLPTVINLVSAGAAALGALEDRAIVEGVPAAAGGVPAVAGGAPAVAGGVPAVAGGAPAVAGGAPAFVGRRLRQRAIPHGSLNRPAGAPSSQIKVRAPARRAGADIVRAVSDAMAELENANRPGTYSLILQYQLVSLLNLPSVAGAAPEINAISALIGGNQIVGTRALRNANNRHDVCGILFRFDPPAVDLVLTQLPALIVLGKKDGLTNLRIEESIAVRVLDPTAVHYLEY